MARIDEPFWGTCPCSTASGQTHKTTFTIPFPESGRLFMWFDRQLLAAKPPVRSFRLRSQRSAILRRPAEQPGRDRPASRPHDREDPRGMTGKLDNHASGDLSKSCYAHRDRHLIGA
jgi:hypothetical protein